jgi:rod shape-determining protein MreD
MERISANNLWVVGLSILVALLLSSIRWPGFSIWLAPEWMLMVVLYWVLALPDRLGVFFAFLMGLLLDVFVGYPLGIQSALFAVIAYIGLGWHKRIRNYQPLQQAALVLFIIVLYLVLKQIFWGFLGRPMFSHPWFLLPALSSAFFWPLVYFSLRSLRIRYRVR